MVDLLEINSSDSILEVGSGPGVGLALASAKAYNGRVVGLDPSETMIAMAERRNRALIEADRVELHRGSVEKLPFDDNTFDNAMTMNSLHLWPDPVAGLREIKRCVRAGGHIAVAFTRFSYVSADRFEGHLIDSGFNDVNLFTSDHGTCALGRA